MGRREGLDSNSRVQVSGRVYWFKSEGREGNNGGLDGRGSRSVEKGWLLQDCRCAQLEAEAETRNTRAKGRQPIHETALRDLLSDLSLGRLRSWWAVSPGQGDALYFWLA